MVSTFRALGPKTIGMVPPAGGEWFSEPLWNRPFRGVTLHAEYCSANAARGVYNGAIILARCQSLTISDIRPLALKFHMAHGTDFRFRALQLERNMTVQYL